jgi:hypothetical protein
MEALFASIALVALAEIGDKTQLLSLALAATGGRFRSSSASPSRRCSITRSPARSARG